MLIHKPRFHPPHSSVQVQSAYGTLDIDFGSGARVAGISGGKGVCIGALAARHYFEMGPGKWHNGR